MLPSVLSVLLATAVLSMNDSMTQDQAVVLAKQAVSKHLAVPVEQITLQQAQAVDWPDSSLGCSQPGMMYMQVITPGFKVLLTAGKESYPVHVGGARAVVCVRGAGDASGAKTQAAQAKVELLQRARERLAAMLKVDAANIQVHGIRAGQSGETPGCLAGADKVANTGKRVELEYAGRRYEYRVDSDDVQECT